MARAMMVHANVEASLWVEAVATAAYTRNRSSFQALQGATPYEVWSGRKPSVAHLRIFGLPVYALDKLHHKKLKPKGKVYVFVGYSLTAKAYRLFDKVM